MKKSEERIRFIERPCDWVAASVRKQFAHVISSHPSSNLGGRGDPFSRGEGRS